MRTAVALMTICLVAGAQAATWDLSLRPARDGAVFDVAEEPHVTATVKNVGGTEQAASVSFEVTDFDGRPLSSGNADTTVPKGESRAVDLALGDAAKLPHEEALSLQVILTADGAQQADVHKAFGFLPARAITAPPESSPFGLLGEFAWPLLQKLGVRWVRPNWSWTERPMDWAQRHGMAYCPLINEANAFVRGELTEGEYADFVKESVRRYRGYIHYWQLGNEFDIFHRDAPRAYVESQRIGYAAAKAADPKCVVINGSITELQVRKEGWRESLQLGLAKYCDVYDFHFYQDRKTTGDLLDYIHQTCRELKAEKPIWCTEFCQFPFPDNDDRNQARDIYRRFAYLLANGVSVAMWHCYRWPYPYSTDRTAATAVVDYDNFARPSLFAYAAMTRELTGAKFKRSWPIGETAFAIEFARGDRSDLVVWSEKGSKPLRVRVAEGTAAKTLVSGRRVPLDIGGGIAAITAGDDPTVYDLPTIVDVH